MTPTPCYNRVTLLHPPGTPFRCAICGAEGVTVAKSATSPGWSIFPLHYAPGDEPRELEIN